MTNKGRRKLLGLVAFVPVVWTKPVIEHIILPLHAQMSPTSPPPPPSSQLFHMEVVSITPSEGSINIGDSINVVYKYTNNYSQAVSVDFAGFIFSSGHGGWSFTSVGKVHFPGNGLATIEITLDSLHIPLGSTIFITGIEFDLELLNPGQHLRFEKFEVNLSYTHMVT